MREDLVTPAVARQLALAGLAWEPQIGDWCTVLGAADMEMASAGLWLVAAVADAGSMLGVVDAAGRWSMARVAGRDCLWLPSSGKLKTWLRAQGCSVATGEAPAHLLGSAVPMTRHVCRATRVDLRMPLDGEGLSEADAVASVLLRLLDPSRR